MRSQAAGALGLLFGLALGGLLDRAVTDTLPIDAGPGDCPRCPTTESCRAPVEEALAALRARDERLHGTPVPFPDHPRSEHRPDQFRADLQQVLAECDLDVELVDVDCDEYPCLALLGTGTGASLVVACPAWSERYSDGPYLEGDTLITADGERGWSLVAGWGPGLLVDDNLGRRLELRRDRAGADLAARWDGRERTREEEGDRRLDALESEIERWLGLAGEGKLTAEQLELRVQILEDQIEELLP